MNNRTVHFVGIGGIGMSSLARHLLAKEWTVSGSDSVASDITDGLSDSGATVYIGHSADNVPDCCDLVVYTSAVHSDNVEIVYARQHNITVILREQLLGQIFNSYRQRVAICGTHGKTTTTAMLHYVMRTIGIRHTAFIGGMSVDTHVNYASGGNIVLAEACEYRDSFAYLFPSVILALNIEWDHPDYYKSIEQMYDSYVRFFGNMDSSGTIIACGDSVPTQLLQGRMYITYGTSLGCTYRAVNITHNMGKYTYTLCIGDQEICPIELNVVGRHNINNSLAVIALCRLFGLDIAMVAPIIAGFCGAERRWSVVPCRHIALIEDYAHHPTEINTVIDSAYDMGYSNILLVFQPHTYTRTQALWRGFVQSLSRVGAVGILPIYSAREQPIEDVSSRLMARSINVYTNSVAYSLEDIDEAYQYIVDNSSQYDVVLIVGAGDIYKLSHRLQCDW